MMARERWHDAAFTAEQIAVSTSIHVRVLYRELGPRGTPIFGKVPQKRRRRK